MDISDLKLDITPRIFTDSIEIMCAYIEKMRLDEDFDTIPAVLNRFNEKIFKNKEISKDQLRQLAVYATDYIYRFAADLEVRDTYTVVYFKNVIAKLMRSLRERGIEVFYVLDNEIRQDRFELTTMLYELSGAAVVVPYDGNQILSFGAVEDRLKSHMAHGRRIVYIEKDASVNYMGKVMKIATESKYTGIFRNQAPTSNHIMVL